MKLSTAELDPVLHNWLYGCEVKIHLYMYTCSLNCEQCEGRIQFQ